MLTVMKNLAIATLLAAVIAAFIISGLYNKSVRNSTVFLGLEENNLNDMIGPQRLYDFYVEPGESPDSAITWEQLTEGPGQKLLKINFEGDSARHYKGLSLSISLPLAVFYKKGAIEMWVKADNRINAPSELGIFLKDVRGYQQQVEFSVPLKPDNRWQKLTIHFKEFKAASFNKGNTGRFSWEIDRIAFSLAPFVSRKPAVLWIRDFRIINDGKVISTVF